MSGRLNQLLQPVAATAPADESGWPTGYASPPYYLPRFDLPNMYQGQIPTAVPDQQSAPGYQRQRQLLLPSDPASYNQLLRMLYLTKLPQA